MRHKLADFLVNGGGKGRHESKLAGFCLLTHRFDARALKILRLRGVLCAVV
jgi:hypothetical protein